MKLSRRQALLAGLGLVLSGCATSGSASGTPRPGPAQMPSASTGRIGPAWPDGFTRPTPVHPQPTVAPPPPPAPVVQAPAPAPPAPARPGFSPIARSEWTRNGPVPNKVYAMNGVNRITVHHEGWKLVTFTDYRTTASRIAHIRDSHVADRKWGDIGYHYVIDRAGRVWEGRNVRYQGAHVSECNEHNLGIMLLGNFDMQSPHDAQISSLRDTLRYLMAANAVPLRRVYTHRELKPTACPGKSLQPRVNTLRSGGYLT